MFNPCFRSIPDQITAASPCAAGHVTALWKLQTRVEVISNAYRVVDVPQLVAFTVETDQPTFLIIQYVSIGFVFRVSIPSEKMYPLS